jgi:phosphatidylglycerophosphate synthase
MSGDAASNSGEGRAAPYSQIVAQLANAQKGRSRGAPAYSIYVNRKVGRYFAAGAYKAGLTPNAVTGVSAAFTFTAIVLIALLPPSWPLGIGVWLLLAVGYAFDSADGQVARLRGGGSPSGEWLDHIVDATKISSLHLAVLISMYRFFDLPNPALLLVPIVYCLVAAVIFFAIILNEQLERSHRAAPQPGEHSSLLRSLVAAPMDYGILCLVFILLGSPPVFFVVYSLFLIANTLYLIVASNKWFHDMARLGTHG